MVAAQGAVPLQEHTGQFGCHDGYLRGFGLITDGKVSEVTVAHQLAFAPGTMVADDRGYNDYRLFAEWTEAGVYFVTRLKANAQFKVIKEREPTQHRRITKDQTIHLTEVGALEKCPIQLRHIKAFREDPEEILVFP